jgi:geranylgeranylglycerol-phosphate geranylgeranyltransferase
MEKWVHVRSFASAGSWLTIIRVRSCFSGALLFALGMLSHDGHVPVTALLFGAGSMWSAVAQINVVNDIADRALDSVDKPWRPLPSGEISLRAATVSCVVLGIGSVALGLAAGRVVALGVGVLIAASILYSAILKSTVLVGNIVVALASTVPFVAGSVEARAVSAVVLIEEGMLTAFMLAFEIVKTTADFTGDGEAGLSTIAIRWGPDTGLRAGVFAFYVCCAIALSLVAYAGRVRGMLFGLAFARFVVAPVVRCYYGGVVTGGLAHLRARELFRGMQKVWKFGFLCLLLLAYRR